jgi:methylthioribose-1-phosphate isomerase
LSSEPDKPAGVATDLKTVSWAGDALTGVVRLIDQTKLPGELSYLDCRDVAALFEAIRSLRVRGAPAIGIAAAYGVVLGARSAGWSDARAVRLAAVEASQYLRTSRPTAVNLFWALDRMERVVERAGELNGRELLAALWVEAGSILEEDRRICRAMGQHGKGLVPAGGGVLTHCNAGGLATADYGTALGVLFAAAADGVEFEVYADETRPLLQGARLTAWELQQRGIPVTLICDNMAGWMMKRGKIQMVIVGADRIAANGDTANKIGTYGVAVLARAHGIPFYVAAPASTFDLAIPDGSHIPIEERHAHEVTHPQGRAAAPEGIRVANPAFDVTPAELITGIVTEHGMIAPVNPARVSAVLARP